MGIILNSLNVLGIFLSLIGFIFLLGLSFRLVFHSDKLLHPLRKFIIYFLLLTVGLSAVSIISKNSIKISNVKVINTSVNNPEAITMNLKSNAEVHYSYNKKYISLNFENGIPSFHIKATASKKINIITVQKYHNAFWVNTVETTKTIINYSN
ncbi:hypothetical protein [Apilactobacillus xinyiensis]|uniref:hypothetical protein n=1 Tax=Apilactobacillus xinyiensis TaxID=2841032 RepID=UPI00200D0C18|nr:hypothetical protein [Apilactobacillus xinyiensis]MCL0318945.1 hypothetical protein [Apilactobacillus xinyiensis]